MGGCASSSAVRENTETRSSKDPRKTSQRVRETKTSSSLSAISPPSNKAVKSVKDTQPTETNNRENNGEDQSKNNTNNNNQNNKGNSNSNSTNNNNNNNTNTSNNNSNNKSSDESRNTFQRTGSVIRNGVYYSESEISEEGCVWQPKYWTPERIGAWVEDIEYLDGMKYQDICNMVCHNKVDVTVSQGKNNQRNGKEGR